MVVVDHVCRAHDLPEAAWSYRRDTITLGWEDRARAHGRRVTDGGIEFGASLPRGTVLRDGDCFVLDAAQTVVSVVALPEPVFVIEPRTPQEWALFAYHIGNRHQPVMMTDSTLLCPGTPGVELLLHQHQIPFTRATKVFAPAAVVAGHQH